MASRRVNCLNVASAAAVGMYYLSRGGIGKQSWTQTATFVVSQVLGALCAAVQVVGEKRGVVVLEPGSWHQV